MTTDGFEERLMRELRTYVHERAQERPQADDATAAADGGAYLTNAAGADHRGARPRLLAIGACLAATAAAAAVAVFSAGTTTGVAGTAPGATAQAPLFQAVNAAYTVQQEPAGVVKLTILDASGRPDVEALRSDLAQAGVNASVIVNVPPCTRPQPHPRATSRPGLPPANLVPDRVGEENGQEVYYLDTKEVTPGTTFSLLFGQTLGEITVGLSPPGYPLLTCIPNATYH
jgi:hypothetical protein